MRTQSYYQSNNVDMRLRDIPTSCKMFDKAIGELDVILREIEDLKGEVIDEYLIKKIKDYVDYTKDNIEEGRSINGELRDCCVEIADAKDEEILKLQEEIDNLSK